MDYWVDAQRLRNMTHKAPGVFAATWDARVVEGWVWVENLDVTQYGISSQTVASAQNDRGAENVAVGHPWDHNEEAPGPFSNHLVGLYIKGDQPTINELVFSLHRDFDRWLYADEDDPFAE